MKVLPKPFSQFDLLTIIRQTLDDHQRSRV
jgi:hypothetical protein